MSYNNDEVKANAQKFGPKKPNGFTIFVNANKQKGDKQPSLKGYATDKDMNLSSVSLWKGQTKKGTIKFTGVNEDLGIKQNVVEMPTPTEQPKPDNFDDEIPY